MVKEQKKPPLHQPELPNIPPAPQKPYMVYMVEIIEHKEKAYCKVDTLKIPKEITDVEKVENEITIGEVYAIVRGLERVLNKLKKHNITLKLTQNDSNNSNGTTTSGNKESDTDTMSN